MSRKVTLVIPTSNRPQYIERLCSFYAREFSRDTVAALILDGSSEASARARNREAAEKSSVHHREAPSELDVISRIAQGLETVETAYSVVVGDDDFVFPRGLEDCVAFLEQHPDYVQAHGRYVAFEDDECRADRTITFYEGPSYEEDDPGARFVAAMSPYLAPNFYAVGRAQALARAFRCVADLKVPNVGKVTHDAFISETVLLGAAIVQGKIKRLDTMFAARRMTGWEEKLVHFPAYVFSSEFPFRFAMIRNALLNVASQTAVSSPLTVAIENGIWNGVSGHAVQEGARIMQRLREISA